MTYKWGNLSFVFLDLKMLLNEMIGTKNRTYFFLQQIEITSWNLQRYLV